VQHMLFSVLADAQALDVGIRISLSAMNFLQFAIWGAWFVVLGQYLHSLNFTGKQIGSVYATMSLGSIVTPLLFGVAADKFIPSEYLMAILHLGGAVLLYVMAQIRRPKPFFWVALCYALVYSPTLTLSNSIIFSHSPEGQRDFPTIRVLGTIGWIAANLYLKVLLKPGEPVNNRPLLLASGLSIVLGLYSFFLPETPPTPGANPLDAMDLFQETSFAVFFVVSFVITIALAFYYSFTSLYLEQKIKVQPGNVGPLMTIGQWVEIIFMLLLPTFLKDFGMKWVLVVGMAAWGIRYAIFSIGRPFWLILVGLGLHGICFDFFFTAGFIYVDQSAPKDLKASGQALFGALTYGLGMYLGTELSGWVNQRFTKEIVDPATQQKIKVVDWSRFWLVPCIGVLICLVPFVILFSQSKP
jgi:nucleoside transporter